MGRELDLSALVSPEPALALFSAREKNPFLKFRRLFHSYRVAREGALSDADYRRIVTDLDAAVERVDGRGFRQTPFFPAEALGEELGLRRLWIKDETGNVAGSHKARHLIGVMIWLAVATRLGRLGASTAPLAIASCGNAALAAAVVARAAGRSLEVFVPPNAQSSILDKLRALEALIHTCPRNAGETGDPCYLRFHEALTRGALPFSVQGNENALAIEGGATLAWEIAATLLDLGPDPEKGALDRLFIQVGGGALAAASIQGLKEALHLGVLERMPRIHAVQTQSVHPLVRAWDHLADRLLQRLTRDSQTPTDSLDRPEKARWIRDHMEPEQLDEELRYAASHRSEFMWPWETESRSLAYGILDDETYDWLAVVEGMLRTGGYPLVVSEETLAEAHRLAREKTAIPVEPTGSAGLAGVLTAFRDGDLAPEERIAVLFTGVEHQKRGQAPIS